MDEERWRRGGTKMWATMGPANCGRRHQQNASKQDDHSGWQSGWCLLEEIVKEIEKQEVAHGIAEKRGSLVADEARTASFLFRC